VAAGELAMMATPFKREMFDFSPILTKFHPNFERFLIKFHEKFEGHKRDCHFIPNMIHKNRKCVKNKKNVAKFASRDTMPP